MPREAGSRAAPREGTGTEAHLFGRLTPALAARRALLRAVRPIDRTESAIVTEAFGRVAARAVRAPRNVPPFARATWDGYALRSADLRGASPSRPRELRVVGEVFAEGGFRGRVGPGEAVAIATGGAVPPGADAVEIFEEVVREGPTVRLHAPLRPGSRIAPVGDDLRRGELLVRPGEVLGPATLGAVAACGVPSLEVFARPIVAIVPNGNELRPPGSRARAGEIYESNNASLSAVVSGAGGVARPVPPVADDAKALERTLRAALRGADLVIATGGSSVGERDHLPTILPKLGELLFHGVAVRPGKPTLAARAGRKLVLGLPGHPTSCLLNMHWLVLPALRRLARLPGPGWTERTVRVAASLPPAGRTMASVVPLRVHAGAVSSTFHGSSAIRSLRDAEAFAFLPPGHAAVPRGSRLTVFLLDPPLGRPGTV